MTKKAETISGNNMVGHLSAIEYENDISRRSFINFTLGTLAGLTLGGGLTSRVQGATTVKIPSSPIILGVGDPFKESLAIPPLFCTAYITPDAPGQGNQEGIVARYPLTLVPQDIRTIFRTWRDKVKTINPRIIMLGYLQVITETTVPGPGHDILRGVQNSFCIYPDGTVPIVFGSRRIFDPRTKEWKDKFIDACSATLKSYPYHGLFLDNCTIFNIASPITSVIGEMKFALQETLLELRKLYPNITFVGNSSYSWAGLNGEMNEGRPVDIPKELAPFAGHVLPKVELFQTLLNNVNDIEMVKREMTLAHAYGAFYGACVTGTQVLWFDIFNEVISGYNNNY